MSASWGNKNLVHLLLAKGAEVNIQGGVCGSALQTVSSKGLDVNRQGGESL